jgi:hypothetical protein
MSGHKGRPCPSSPFISLRPSMDRRALLVVGKASRTARRKEID